MNKFIIWVLVSTPFFSFAEVKKATGGIINVNFTMIMQWINFFLLMWLLYKYMYNPILQFLDERKEKIENSLEDAAKAREEAEKLKKEYEKLLKETAREREKILHEAKVEAENIRKEILNNAQEMSLNVVKELEIMINRLKEVMMKDVKLEAATIATSLARQLLKEKVSKEDEKRLIAKLIKELEKDEKK